MRATIDAVRARFSVLAPGLSRRVVSTSAGGEVAGASGDVTGPRGDVAKARGEIARARGEVAGARGGVASAKGDVAGRWVRGSARSPARLAGGLYVK